MISFSLKEIGFSLVFPIEGNFVVKFYVYAYFYF